MNTLVVAAMGADGGATEERAEESQRLLPPESAGAPPQQHDSAPLAHSACWAVAALGLVAWCWILMFAGWQTMEVLLSTFRDELGYYSLVFVYAGIVPGSLVTPYCPTPTPFIHPLTTAGSQAAPQSHGPAHRHVPGGAAVHPLRRDELGPGAGARAGVDTPAVRGRRGRGLRPAPRRAGRLRRADLPRVRRGAAAEGRRRGGGGLARAVLRGSPGRVAGGRAAGALRLLGADAARRAADGSHLLLPRLPRGGQPPATRPALGTRA